MSEIFLCEIYWKINGYGVCLVFFVFVLIVVRCFLVFFLLGIGVGFGNYKIFFGVESKRIFERKYIFIL